MKLVVLVALLWTAGALLWFRHVGIELRPSFVGAIFVMIVGSLGLAGALMGLVFFSSTSGVDEDADSFQAEP